MHEPDESSTTLPSGIWRYRDLLIQFSVRNIELKHKGSLLGFVWAIANPLLLLCLYVGVFGFIFDGTFGVIENESRIDYSLGVFLGLSLFHFLAEVISLSPLAIVSNPNLVKKILFPLEILPLSQVIAAGFHLMISLGLILVGLAIWGEGLNLSALAIPLFVGPIVLLAMGFGWLNAALGVFLRDLQQVTQFGALALMFASAIFYPASQIPEGIAWILRLNPLLLMVEFLRHTLLWGTPINVKELIYAWALCGAFALLGYRFFIRLKPAFADVL